MTNRYYALVRRVILETHEVLVDAEDCEDGQQESELAEALFEQGAGTICRAAEEYDTGHEADFQIVKVWEGAA